jgi:hypothetical protein
LRLGGIFVEGSKWEIGGGRGCGGAFVGLVGDVMKMVSWQLCQCCVVMKSEEENAFNV